MIRSLKITLAVLLLICLADMPYGYYQFVRLTSFAIFLFLGFRNNTLENKNLSYTYFFLALLFQPFFKIALGRELWNTIDIVVAVFLLLSIIKIKK